MADEPTTTRRVYLVVSSYWSYNDEFYTGDSDTPQKAFTSREKAEAYVRACEHYFESPAGRSELSGAQADITYQIIETEVAV